MIRRMLAKHGPLAFAPLKPHYRTGGLNWLKREGGGYRSEEKSISTPAVIIPTNKLYLLARANG